MLSSFCWRTQSQGCLHKHRCFRLGRSAGSCPRYRGSRCAALGIAPSVTTSSRDRRRALRPPGSSRPLLFEPQVLMTVDGVLTDVLDLTNPSTQTALGTSHQELTGPWLVQQSSYLAGQGRLPPTQVLGQQAFAAGRLVGL